MTQDTNKKIELDQSELDGISAGYSLMEEWKEGMDAQTRRDYAFVAAARAAETAAEAAAEAAANAPPKRDYGRYSGGRLS